VNFVVSGSPTVMLISRSVGKLTISGSGTLNTNQLQVFNCDLAISGATVNVNSSGALSDGVYVSGNDLIMSSGTLTVTATGSNSIGINTNGGGNLYISGTASVSATSTNSDGIYCDEINVSGGTLFGESTDMAGIRTVSVVTISGGSVTANSNNTVRPALYAAGDVDVAGGTLTTAGGSNGNLQTGGSLKVNGAATNVFLHYAAYGTREQVRICLIHKLRILSRRFRRCVYPSLKKIFRFL
jgi:hypothetical protein